MKKKTAKGNAKTDYKKFINDHLIQILGLPIKENNVKEVKTDIPTKGPITYIPEKKTLYFSDYNKALFYINGIQSELTEENLRVARDIIQIYYSIARYKFDGGGRSIHNRYPSDAMRLKSYENAVQEGICRWISGGLNPNITTLLQALEKWSVKTYEGKKVTFAFIINPEEESTFTAFHDQKWLDFLTSDYAATLTDCIHSAIMLDKNCNFVRYISLTEGNKSLDYSLDGYLPYRFAGIIQNYVQNKAIGIFLLINGDILLSKNGEIRFIRRNLKWLNSSFGAFKNAIKNLVKSDTLQKAIYASVLDVSFAHTGGIIAIVKDIDKLTKPEDKILSDADYLQTSASIDEIAKSIKKLNPSVTKKETKKILLKRAALSALIGDNSFSTLDRKLRTELISMDGACIIDTEGNICSAGAIIKNDSGSSEGGRGAAAKKLSRYGIAIKISTDGYIDVYENKKARFSIK